MTTRDRAPLGAPCWADLWTSDVEGSRKFYSELFGWEALEPNPEFGGYFMFIRQGAPVAGGMGDMSDQQADNTWKVYLATDDAAALAGRSEAQGAKLFMPPVPVADLGVQVLMTDPTGVTVGAWQPGTFQGFAALEEPGAPAWFELHTRDHDAAVAFYQAAFGWDTKAMDDAGELRYTLARKPGGEGEMAGILDAGGFLPEGAGGQWYIYWTVEDTDAAVEKVKSLGGSVIDAPEDTPHGRLATVADPSGAVFKLGGPTH